MYIYTHVHIIYVYMCVCVYEYTCIFGGGGVWLRMQLAISSTSYMTGNKLSQSSEGQDQDPEIRSCGNPVSF